MMVNGGISGGQEQYWELLNLARRQVSALRLWCQLGWGDSKARGLPKNGNQMLALPVLTDIIKKT
jgi:hypothetical protein